MPYVSKAQLGYMHAYHPEIAARWDKLGVPRGLPYHVKKKARPKGKGLQRFLGNGGQHG